MKLLLVGNVNAGKTSLVRRYTHDEFSDSYKATIGVDFGVKGDVTLWDIAGQERFGCMTSTFYRGADGAIVCIDWTNRDSPASAEAWIKDLKSKISVPILLVANKCDQPSCLTLEDVETIRHVIGWRSVSAKTGEGVNEAIEFIIEAAKKNIKEKTERDLIILSKAVEYDESCC